MVIYIYSREKKMCHRMKLMLVKRTESRRTEAKRKREMIEGRKKRRTEQKNKKIEVVY